MPINEDSAETAAAVVSDDAEELLLIADEIADVAAEEAADLAAEVSELKSMFVSADIVLSTFEFVTNPVELETIPKAKSL